MDLCIKKKSYQNNCCNIQGGNAVISGNFVKRKYLLIRGIINKHMTNITVKSN